MKLPRWNVNQKAHRVHPSSANSVIYNTGGKKVLEKVGVYVKI